MLALATMATAGASLATERLPFFVYGTLMLGFENNANVMGDRGGGYLRCSINHSVICHFEVGYPGL